MRTGRFGVCRFPRLQTCGAMCGSPLSSARAHVHWVLCSLMCSQMRCYFDRGLNQMVGLSCKHKCLKDINSYSPRRRIISLSVSPWTLAFSISHGLHLLFKFMLHWAFQYKFSICLCGGLFWSFPL